MFSFNIKHSVITNRYLITISLLICTIVNSFSQDSLVNVANQHYQNGKYIESGEAYDAYFETSDGSARDFYNAACVWSLANQKEKALTYLDSAFVYGFSNIEHVESDLDLSNIRNTKTFQDLVGKETTFYSKTHIDFKDLIEALLERKVVSFEGKTFSNSYGDGLDDSYGVTKVLNSFPEGTLKVTKDSLLDFSDRTILISNGIGKIHFESLKIKKLQITNGYDISEGTMNIPFNDWNIVKFNKITADEFNWAFNGYNRVRFSEINAVNTSIFQSNNLDGFNIDRCKLTLSKIYFEDELTTAFYRFGDFNQPLGNLIISNSTFLSTSDAPSIIPLSINANAFYFSSNTIEAELTFSESKVSDLYMSKNVFNKAVDISKTNFYASNNYIPIEQFKDGFGIDDDFIRPWEEKKQKLLITGDEEEVKDKESFDNLSYSYKLMHTNYRERGDLNSANAAYVKLKDITLNRDYYLYKQNGGFELWVQYKVGKLIKFYTNSSTNPARAIVISFLIILAFSIFYMFYPSEWDVKSNPKLIADYKAFVEKNEHGYFKPFFVLVAGFFKSWLNAFTLSLNAFVTLGFGAIPTKGVARYLTIAQGFLGWFLLSLFTVALINQALA
jgi:hypothetical protein